MRASHEHHSVAAFEGGLYIGDPIGDPAMERRDWLNGQLGPRPPIPGPGLLIPDPKLFDNRRTLECRVNLGPRQH